MLSQLIAVCGVLYAGFECSAQRTHEFFVKHQKSAALTKAE
jgi:hypothetical protein